MSSTPYFSSRLTLYSALSTSASADLPYFPRKFFSMLPVFAPTLTGIWCARTQSATRFIRSSPPMFPGLMRILSAPFSTARTASLSEKWMSATTGMGERSFTERIARASRSSRTATRTISHPASYRRSNCARVASVSETGTVVMDCILTGAPPPTDIFPIKTCLLMIFHL